MNQIDNYPREGNSLGFVNGKYSMAVSPKSLTDLEVDT
jgi:hypothetical protein